MQGEQKSPQAAVQLPSFFHPLLWSYDISRIDLERDKKTIIINALNYGDLKHWQWLVSFYGANGVREIITHIPETELRPRVRRLVALMFNIDEFNHARRGTHWKRKEYIR